MGKVTFSPIIGEIRKKIGTDVFTKNHYGDMIRKRVKPINPRTISQMTVRGSLTNLAKLWKTIGSSDILAWNAYAKVYTISDRLGTKMTLTGENWYIKLNRILDTMGQTLTTSPPSL